jgi:inner membrane protein
MRFDSSYLPGHIVRSSPSEAPGGPPIPASAFSHFVVGGALGTLGPRALPAGRMALVLALASALPDLDVVAFRIGIHYGDPMGHRGFSHSLLFAALLAPVLALLCGAHPGRGRGRYLAVCGLAFAAVGSHGALDAFTDAGLGVGFFIPFHDERYFFPWRPIMTSPIGVGAFFSQRGAMILANEAVWIMAPTLIGVIGVRAIAARSRHSDDGRGRGSKQL